MSQSATSGSPNTDNPSSGTPQEETGSFWTQKIGGGAIGISVLLALIRIGPKLVENANRDPPHPQAVQRLTWRKSTRSSKELPVITLNSRSIKRSRLPRRLSERSE